MKGPNLDAFEGSPLGDRWIEIYFSHRSDRAWETAQISYKKDKDRWIPFGKYMLIDAENVRPGFRAFRIQANRLEFRLTDLNRTVFHPSDGSNHVIESPGRYVVDAQSALKKVGNADVFECLRCLRPADRFVEIYYRSNPLWRKSFLTYSLNGASKWVSSAMAMTVSEGDFWFYRVQISTQIEFAFTDGGDEWDNNNTNNYAVFLPGKYAIANNKIMYLGPSNADMHSN